jgi:mannose-6-phosphate isomerase-like protein (cupin superfamily)
VEWAWIPAGGISGEHRHTRTEELYLILTGSGRMRLNGRMATVTPGCLIVNPLGTRHGLYAVNDVPVSWLVIEVLAPSTAATYAAAACRQAPRVVKEMSVQMAEPVVVPLAEVNEFDPSTVLTGPLRLTRIATLGAGECEELAGDGVEHTVFVLAGCGVASSDGRAVQLAPGSSVTLPLGASVTLRGEGLRFFQATLAVEAVGVCA